MNGFGFIEYKDPMDARDVVPGILPLPMSACIDHELTLNIFVVTQPSVCPGSLLECDRENSRASLFRD